MKPSNVLIDEQQHREHCYLADFGITTTVDDRRTDGLSQTAARYARLRRARAGPGRSGRRAGGRVFARMPRLRVPHGRGAIRPRLRGRGRVRAPRGAAAEAERAPAGPAARARCGDRPRAREGSGRPPGELWRAGRRGARRARPGCASAARARAPRRARAASAGVLAAGAIAWAVRSDQAPAPALPETGSVVRIDAATGTVKERFRLSAHPSAVVLGPRVWVADFRQGTLWRIDRRTGDANSFPAIGNPRALAILGGRLYVGSDGPSLLGGNVTRYDALTGGRIDGTTKVVPCSVAAGLGVVYSAGCPNVQRLGTGAAIKVVRETADPAPGSAAGRAPAQLAVRHGYRRGGGLGDRRRTRPSPLQDRAGAVAAGAFPCRSRRRESPPAGRRLDHRCGPRHVRRVRSGQRQDRPAHRDLSAGPTASQSAPGASGSRRHRSGPAHRSGERPHRPRIDVGTGPPRACGRADEVWVTRDAL